MGQRTPDSKLMVIKTHDQQFGPTRLYGFWKVSCQFEPEAEVSPRSPSKFWSGIVAWYTCLANLDENSFQTWNELRCDGWYVADLNWTICNSKIIFVVELLWPRRERRARMKTVALYEIFNALLTGQKTETPLRNIFGRALLWWHGLSRILWIDCYFP